MATRTVDKLSPMQRSKGLLFGISALSSLVVLGGALLWYRELTRVPLLAGRADPVTIYEDPTILFNDPGLLGSAIEVRVTEAVSACMESAGLSYRGPAVVGGLDALLGPDDGYGIATGPPPPGVELGGGGPRLSVRDEYEQALYGSALDGAGGSGGCAAAGLEQLDSSLAALASMPYSIEQLEADTLAHSASVEALIAWAGCMELRGYQVDSPLELIVRQTERMSTASGEEVRRLADEERAIAADDRDCRRGTIDRAVTEVAADLAPTFVDRNRASLQILIPPPLGTGDVQVTLRWSSTVDLDLEVTDPQGAVIDYASPISPSGGELDRDANGHPCRTASSTPVENIFWPTGAAPAGVYGVEVVYLTLCGDLGPQTFELIVRFGGRVVLQETTTIAPGTSESFGFEFPS